MKHKNFPALIPHFPALLLVFMLFHVDTAYADKPACGELVISKCTSCHYETRICQKVKKRKGKGSWKRTLKSMIRNGAVINREEQKRLLQCLSTPDSEVLKLCEIKNSS